MEFKDSITEKTDPQEILSKNPILTYKEKEELIVILRRSRHLKKLVYELYNRYAVEVF